MTARLLTARAASRLLLVRQGISVHPRTIRRWAIEGRLQHARRTLGGYLLVSVAEIEALCTKVDKVDNLT
jgi:DNA-binding transcriptional MerR regulator